IDAQMLGYFELPVELERRGADNQCRKATRHEQAGEHLHGFAEPLVVSQQAAEPAAQPLTHPGGALNLVRVEGLARGALDGDAPRRRHIPPRPRLIHHAHLATPDDGDGRGASLRLMEALELGPLEFDQAAEANGYGRGEPAKLTGVFAVDEQHGIGPIAARCDVDRATSDDQPRHVLQPVGSRPNIAWTMPGLAFSMSSKSEAFGSV